MAESNRKKMLILKKTKSKSNSVEELSDDLDENMTFADETELVDDIDTDVVTFYVQQVLRLGRKSHATVEVDMDKNLVKIFKARSDKERRTGDESAKVFPCSACTKFELYSSSSLALTISDGSHSGKGKIKKFVFIDGAQREEFVNLVQGSNLSIANKARSRLSLDDSDVLNHAESFRSYTQSQEELSKVFKENSTSSRSLMERKFIWSMLTYKRSVDIGRFKGEGNLNATINDYVDTWGIPFYVGETAEQLFDQTTYVLYRDRVNKRDRTVSFVTPKSLPLRGELILSNYRVFFNAYETHSADDIEYPLFMISDVKKINETSISLIIKHSGFAPQFIFTDVKKCQEFISKLEKNAYINRPCPPKLFIAYNYRNAYTTTVITAVPDDIEKSSDSTTALNAMNDDNNYDNDSDSDHSEKASDSITALNAINKKDDDSDSNTEVTTAAVNLEEAINSSYTKLEAKSTTIFIKIDMKYRYNAVDDYRRIGLIAKEGQRPTPFRVYTNNYKLSPTYPAKFVVPSKIDDDMLKEIAKYRSKARIPAVTWIHNKSRGMIVRCAQPMRGAKDKRCAQDELFFKVVRDLSKRKDKLYIVDARAEIAAMGNRAMGKGTENIQHYEHSEKLYCNIGNIHTMRQSLNLLVDVCEPTSIASGCENWWTQVEQTGWLRHVALVLIGAKDIAYIVEQGMSVVIHCSDGWDRTAQLAALSELLLDPYYRTIDGFAILVEKHWCSFGYKFHDRCGHGDGNPKSEERSPIFLQFLDCVWQLLQQYPNAFEFNAAFLLLLADAHMSCLYGTFLFNTEMDRLAHNVFEETVSIWTDIERKVGLFKNKNYVLDQSCLIPRISSRNIKLWEEFYCRRFEHWQC
eukprot:g9545.t1